MLLRNPHVKSKFLLTYKDRIVLTYSLVTVYPRLYTNLLGALWQEMARTDHTSWLLQEKIVHSECMPLARHTAKYLQTRSNKSYD